MLKVNLLPTHTHIILQTNYLSLLLFAWFVFSISYKSVCVYFYYYACFHLEYHGTSMFVDLAC